MAGLDYDWIEIGTAHFETLGVGGAPPLSRGALVEPLAIYLDQLIDSPNITKANVAICKDEGRASIYYIPPETIAAHGLPWWLHGCNSMHKPHVLNIKELEARGLSLDNISESTVECITWATLVDRLNVGHVSFLKIDTEGGDCEIVSQVLRLGETQPHLLPARIQFETNAQAADELISATIASLESRGYRITLRGENTEAVRDADIIKCMPKVILIGDFTAPPRTARFDVRMSHLRCEYNHASTVYDSTAQAHVMVCRDPADAAATATTTFMPVAGTSQEVVDALTAAGADAWLVTCDAEWEALFERAIVQAAAPPPEPPAPPEPPKPPEPPEPPAPPEPPEPPAPPALPALPALPATAHPNIFNNLVYPPEECIPRILHMIWVGGSAPEYCWENAFKWRVLMPHWTVRLWTDTDLATVPEPVRNAVNSSNCGAQKADILRYWIVYEHGGVYADADIVPHRSLDPIIAIGARVVVCHDLEVTWGYIINAFFAAAPKEPLFERASLKSLSVEYNTPDVHMKTGPRLFGECLEAVDGKYMLLPVDMFYRNEGNNLRYGTHTYAHSWRTP